MSLEYDRTYWSDYKNLDFNYGVDLTTTLGLSGYDLAIPKKMERHRRLAYQALTYDMKKQFLYSWPVFAIDENPVPIGHPRLLSLPDFRCAALFVGCAAIQSMKIWRWGFAYLYDDKESRTVTNSTVQGTFKDASAHLVTPWALLGSFKRPVHYRGHLESLFFSANLGIMLKIFKITTKVSA